MKHEFYARASVEKIEITELGSAVPEFLDISHGFVAYCLCGWSTDGMESMKEAKQVWSLGHMGWPRAKADGFCQDVTPMTDAEKRKVQKRKQQIVDRFV